VQPKDRGSIPGSGNRLFSKTSRSALGHTQLPIQWITGSSSLGSNVAHCEADNSPSLPRSWRMSTAIPPLPPLHITVMTSIRTTLLYTVLFPAYLIYLLQFSFLVTRKWAPVIFMSVLYF